MSRDPKLDEIKRIRRLLNAAGSVAELRRWITIARKHKGRKGGRKAQDSERRLTTTAIQVVMGHQRGISPRTTLRNLFEQREKAMNDVEPGSFQKHFGQNAKAVYQRRWRHLRGSPSSGSKQIKAAGDAWANVGSFVRQITPTKKPKRR